MSQHYQMNISSVKQLKKNCKHKDKDFSLDARVLVLIDLVVEDKGPQFQEGNKDELVEAICVLSQL